MPRYDEDRGPGPRGPAPLDQRLDRWVNAGRQLVDGVSGVRPGSRPGSRDAGRRPGAARLGRWVEERLDWLLDDSDDWREPWQQDEPSSVAAPQAPRTVAPPAPSRPRRSLDAISRRGQAPRPAAPPAAPTADAPAAAADWPDDADFSLPRWQRPAPVLRPMEDLAGPPPPPPQAGGRALPRSSRRRA